MRHERGNLDAFKQGAVSESSLVGGLDQHIWGLVRFDGLFCLVIAYV